MKHQKLFGLFIIMLIVGASFYFYPYHHKTEHISSSPQAETSDTPNQQQSADLPASVPDKTYIGFVVPINSVAVHPFISGFVDDILVAGGEYVSENQPLIILQQDQYKAMLLQAQAGVAKAEAALNNAQTYYDRLIKAGSKAVSPTQLDSAAANLKTARAGLLTALADLEQAKVNFRYTILSAGISGKIGQVNTTRGTYVAPQSEALLQLVQLSPIRVEFSIPTVDYLQYQETLKNWTVQLKLPDGTMYPETTTIEFFNNQINPITDSLTLYADFENTDRKLLPNSYVEVVISHD